MTAVGHFSTNSSPDFQFKKAMAALASCPDAIQPHEASIAGYLNLEVILLIKY